MVATTRKFPGFTAMSRFYPITFTNPDAVISRDQYEFIIADSFKRHPSIFGDNSPPPVPIQSVFIDLNSNVTATDTLLLKSELQTFMDTK